MAKILYITTTYLIKNSSAAIRNNSVVKGLVELGHDVDVFTLEWAEDLSSPFFIAEKNGNIHTSKLSNLTRIANVKKKLSHNGKFTIKLKQIIKKILFFPDECSEWIKTFDYSSIKHEDYACMITSSDHKTSHFIGFQIKKQFPNIPWIQIWGDPWSGDLSTMGFMKGITSHYEAKLLKKADKIVYVSIVTANEIQKKFPKMKEKIYYIPRSFYPISHFTDIKDSESKIRIIYTGLITAGRNIFHLIDVINSVQMNNKSIVFDIYGQLAQEIKERLAIYPNVNVHNGVDFEHMAAIYDSASILLFLSNTGGSSQIPGKFFDYMGTTKPILCFMDDEEDEVSAFLKKFDRCLVLKNDLKNIRMYVQDILKHSNRKYMPEQDFAPQKIASHIINLLEIN